MVDKLSYSAPPKLLVLPPIAGTGGSGGGGDRRNLGEPGGRGRHGRRNAAAGDDTGTDGDNWWHVTTSDTHKDTLNHNHYNRKQLRRRAVNNYPLSGLNPYISTRSHILYGFPSKKPAGNQGFMANALFHAVQTCRFSRVKVLIDQGLRPRVKDGAGRNLLMACLEVGDDAKRWRMFSYLLRRGADPHYVDDTSGRDVITCAVVLRRDAQVRQLLDSTVGDLDLRRVDKEGYTALHHAALAGSLDVTRMLVASMQRYQIPVDAYDRQGLTPYIHARRLGHHAIADVLVQQGQASPRQADKHSFRGPDEWEAEGVQERHRKLRERRMQEHIRRKISGRFLPNVLPEGAVKGNSCPRIYVNGDSDSSVEESAGNSGGNSSRVDGTRDDVVDGRRLLQRNKLDIPEVVSRKYSDPAGRQRALQMPNKASTLNFMEDAAILTNTDQFKVAEFKSSEFDVNKQNEYKSIAVDVTALMTSLSEQQSTAFRKTVVPPPIPPKPIIIEAPRKSKEKVSTLAILMGKGGQRKPCGKRKTGKSDKKKKSDGRKKPGLTLPRI